MQNCAAGALIWRGCGLWYRLSADWPHPGGPLRQFYHFRCLGQSWKHYCRKRLLGQQTALVTSRGPCCEDSEGWSPENMGTRGSGGHRTGLFRFTTNKHLPSPVQALPVLIYPPPSHPLTMKWAAVGDQLYALFCQSFSNPLIRSVIHLSVQQAVFLSLCQNKPCETAMFDRVWLQKWLCHMVRSNICCPFTSIH